MNLGYNNGTCNNDLTQKCVPRAILRLDGVVTASAPGASRHAKPMLTTRFFDNRPHAARVMGASPEPYVDARSLPGPRAADIDGGADRDWRGQMNPWAEAQHGPTQRSGVEATAALGGAALRSRRGTC